MKWLAELIERLTCLWPETRIIAEYERGVRILLGRWSKELKPGWYVFIPLFQRVLTMEVQTQVVDLRVQSVRTKDAKDIAVSGAIQYSIKDIKKAMFNVQDLDKSLQTVGLGIILEFVSLKTMEELRGLTELRGESLKGIRDASRGWGVKVEKIFITDIGYAYNLRLLGSQLVTQEE